MQNVPSWEHYILAHENMKPLIDMRKWRQVGVGWGFEPWSVCLTLILPCLLLSIDPRNKDSVPPGSPDQKKKEKFPKVDICLDENDPRLNELSLGMGLNGETVEICIGQTPQQFQLKGLWTPYNFQVIEQN